MGRIILSGPAVHQLPNRQRVVQSNRNSIVSIGSSSWVSCNCEVTKQGGATARLLEAPVVTEKSLISIQSSRYKQADNIYGNS